MNKVLKFLPLLSFLSVLYCFIFLSPMINFSLVVCLAALVKKKKSRPELPDLTLKGRVNPDTPISQINEKI